ncbi:sensor histidine kinase [Magnetospira thiophila]
MSDIKRLWFAALVMVVLVVAVAVALSWGSYQTAVAQQQQWLLEVVQANVRLMNAVARFDRLQNADEHLTPKELTLSQILDAKLEKAALGHTGEFVLGRRNGSLITFVIPQRHTQGRIPDSVPLISQLAEPMRRALAGQSGTMIGLDYRRELVLAAYTPVTELDVGMVAKIDMSEIRAPYIRWGLLGSLLVIAFTLLAFYLARRLTTPIITKLDRHAHDLERLNRDLTHSNKEWEAFAYAASHDLQEPLRTVGSFVQLLQRRYRNKLDSEADEYIDFAVAGATRMHDLIQGLLTFSRINRAETVLEPLDMNEIVQVAQDDLQFRIMETSARITLDKLPMVTADKSQMVRLFDNLISNSLKYCDLERPPEIHISARPFGHEWEFSVKDNGIGIEHKFESEIFQLFRRLHGRDKYDGTGVGLALCKKIVERHGGRIWLDPETTQGSRFCFTLPMS